MTNAEYIALAQKMFRYTPNSTKPYQQLFLRTIKKDNKALAEARGLFPIGVNLYEASNNALSNFITYYNFGSLSAKEELKREFWKNEKKR